MKTKKILLIFSGNNDRAIIAFCRYAVSNSIDFLIVANGDEDYIFDTIYKQFIFKTRPKNKISYEDIIDLCKSIKDKNENADILILPSTEFINRLVLQFQDELLSHNIYTCLCDKKIYELVSDKLSFSTLCNDNDIYVPKEYSDAEVKFPCVLKPKSYANIRNEIVKPIIVNNLEEYEKNKIFINDDCFIQEYVGGRSIYLLFYMFKDGYFSVYSQENHVQQHNGASMIISKSTNYHLDTISGKFATIFKNIGYHGMIMVEVKLYNDKYYMIEANPRLWGPSQLINDAGMDLFDCFSIENELLSSAPKRNYQTDIWYFWSGGIISNQNKKLPLSFYNFSQENFIENYGDILKNEIYMRSDTMGLYIKENLTNNE